MESFRTEIEDPIVQRHHRFRKKNPFIQEGKIDEGVFAAFAWHVAFMVSVRKVFKYDIKLPFGKVTEQLWRISKFLTNIRQDVCILQRVRISNFM
jgi:hypothetical protein